MISSLDQYKVERAVVSAAFLAVSLSILNLVFIVGIFFLYIKV